MVIGHLASPLSPGELPLKEGDRAFVSTREEPGVHGPMLATWRARGARYRCCIISPFCDKSMVPTQTSVFNPLGHSSGLRSPGAYIWRLAGLGSLPSTSWQEASLGAGGWIFLPLSHRPPLHPWPCWTPTHTPGNLGMCVFIMKCSCEGTDHRASHSSH